MIIKANAKITQKQYAVHSATVPFIYFVEEFLT